MYSRISALHYNIAYNCCIYRQLRERSFSKLKLILSYLRSSMGQDRFSNLALLSIERGIGMY